MDTDTAQAVLNMLTSMRFATWYNAGNFDSWISGDPGAPTDEQILADIQDMTENV